MTGHRIEDGFEVRRITSVAHQVKTARIFVYEVVLFATDAISAALQTWFITIRDRRLSAIVEQFTEIEVTQTLVPHDDSSKRFPISHAKEMLTTSILIQAHFSAL